MLRVDILDHFQLLRAGILDHFELLRVDILADSELLHMTCNLTSCRVCFWNGFLFGFDMAWFKLMILKLFVEMHG